uniref:G-protein coupled receptors family 1 profile domain-containing protein n=2 Tax=Latimeria chalumnae TaxID=7897 RepID=H3A973_LATCH
VSHNCSIKEPAFEKVFNSNRLFAVSLFFTIGGTLAFLLGVIGNTMVIWVLGFRMKFTETTVCFLNLAVADFLYTLLLPFRIVYAARQFDWPFGNAFCKTDYFMAFLTMYASVYFLMTISLNRCLSVTFPIWYRNFRSPRNSLVVCLIVWAIALCFAFPYLFFSRSEKLHNRTTCFVNYGEGNLKDDKWLRLKEQREDIIIITRFFLGFIFPGIIITTCYVLISVKVRKIKLKRITKLYKVSIATVLAFFICWLPYHLFSLFYIAKFSRPSCDFHPVVYIAYPLVYLFIYINSCINPILYVFIGDGFTRKVKSSIAIVFEQAFNDELSVSMFRSRKKTTKQ